MKKYRTAFFSGLTSIISLENFLNNKNVERENIVSITHAPQAKYNTPEIVLVYLEEVDA